MRGFITEAQAEESLHWLIDAADEIGRAVEEATLTERLVGHVEALQAKAAEGSDARRKEAARTSEAYLRAIYAEAKAAGELAKLLLNGGWRGSIQVQHALRAIEALGVGLGLRPDGW